MHREKNMMHRVLKKTNEIKCLLKQGRLRSLGGLARARMGCFFENSSALLGSKSTFSFFATHTHTKKTKGPTNDG